MDASRVEFDTHPRTQRDKHAICWLPPPVVPAPGLRGSGVEFCVVCLGVLGSSKKEIQISCARQGAR